MSKTRAGNDVGDLPFHPQVDGPLKVKEEEEDAGRNACACHAAGTGLCTATGEGVARIKAMVTFPILFALS